MWVKMTPEELEKARKARAWKSMLVIGIMSIVLTALVAVFPDLKRWQRHALPFRDAVSNFGEMFVPIFVVCGIGELLRRRGSVSEVICPKCGTAKYFDENMDCACGGRFEFLAEMKWKEECRGDYPLNAGNKIGTPMS
jgi:hypothetical protein